MNDPLSRDEAARLAARDVYGSDDIEIDGRARVVHLTESDGDTPPGNAWVQAWLYVNIEQIEEFLDG